MAASGPSQGNGFVNESGALWKAYDGNDIALGSGETEEDEHNPAIYDYD